MSSLLCCWESQIWPVLFFPKLSRLEDSHYIFNFSFYRYSFSLNIFVFEFSLQRRLGTWLNPEGPHIRATLPLFKIFKISGEKKQVKVFAATVFYWYKCRSRSPSVILQPEAGGSQYAPDYKTCETPFDFKYARQNIPNAILQYVLYYITCNPSNFKQILQKMISNHKNPFLLSIISNCFPRMC